MKRRLLYVAFTLLTVLGFASSAQAQNAYAYGLNGKLSEDGKKITVNYSLNAAATEANLILMNGAEVTKTIAVDATGLVAGTHALEIATDGLPTGVDLKWRIEVKGAKIAAPTEGPKTFRFYHPQGVVIDNNPMSENFGRIIVTECMKVTDATYHSSAPEDGQGLYAFDPTLAPIKNSTGTYAFKGGITFSGTFPGGKSSYEPRKVKITEDGRMFVTRQSVSTPLLEVNPADLNAPFVSVFQGTVDETTYETKDAEGNFIASANVGFDVKGKGENLKVLMLSTNASGVALAYSGFRTDEYNLGTAKSWSTAPSKAITLLSGEKTINYSGTSVQYDNEGGIWYIQYRALPKDTEPAIIHINAAGEEDFRDIVTVASGAGFKFNNDFSLVAIANKKAGIGIYEITKTPEQKPTLTLKYEFATNIGSACNDIAWDVANNLYIVGNSGEWFKMFALPRESDVVATPAMDKFAINIPAPEPPAPPADEPTLTQIWKHTEGLAAANDARQATIKDGKIYIQNKLTASLEVWDATGKTAETYATGAGTNIATDDAGNIIVRIGTFPNSFASDVAELRIIPADGSAAKDVTLTNIPAGRADFFGHAKGNVLDPNDGGVLYLMIGGNQSIVVVPIIDGVQDPDNTFAAPYDGVIATSGVINAVGDKLVVYGRAAGNTILEGAMDGETFVKNINYVTPNHNAANGCTTFTMGGVEYILYTSSPNSKYGDGFAIAKATDAADNAVIVENAQTIEGKNGFQSNWVFAEVVSDYKANIYQYYPGGYIAMYEFALPEPEKPVVTELVQKWKHTEGLAAANDARQAAIKDGKIYIQNKLTASLEVWDATGKTAETYATGAGTNIATDDAGNIIVRIGTFPNSFASDVAELRIISADGTVTKDVTLANIPAGRADFFGHAKGNVLDPNDGGVLYLMISGNQSIVVVPIIDGVQDPDNTFAAPYDGTIATSGVINAVGDKLVVYGRAAGNTILEGAMDGETFVKNINYVTPNHNAANGCTTFTMGGVEYILYTSSPNSKYGDGFAIAKASDAADNAVIVENVQTIEGKNSFQGNWVFAEVVSDTKANIYQYYPGGYIAMYEFTTPLPAPEPEAELFMIGQIEPNNYAWAANVGHKMTAGADGIYTTTVKIVESATVNGAPAFAFATKLGANADDWATLNANRYGAAIDGTMIANDTEATLVKSEGAFKIVGWEYLVTVDMKNMTVKCVATTPIPVEYPDALYVIGEIKEAEADRWKTDDASCPLAKSATVEGEYSATNVMLYGAGGFTLTSKVGATWDDINAFRYGPSVGDTELTPDASAPLFKVANSWKIAPKAYDITVNLKDATIVCKTYVGVDNIGAEGIKVIGGVGEINVIGDAASIEVFTAGGALLSRGNSNIQCASGIYFVKVDGKVTKVIVK